MNIVKKIIAILSAAFLLLAASACDGGNKQPETTVLTKSAVTESSTEKYTYSETLKAEATEAASETEAPTTTEAVSTTAEITTTEKAVTTTKKPVTTTQKAVSTTKKAVETTKKPVTTAPKPTTTKKKIVAPASKADIVSLYNKSTAAAASSKVGYNKSTSTSLKNLEMGALANLGVVRDAIGDFLGEGSSTETVAKGSFDGKSLVKSTLKESDVTSANCKLSDDGKYYIVSITVKNETNPQKGNSALGRFTKDYKDVGEIKAGLAQVGASVDSLTVNTTSVTINAKINASNNRFVSLTHSIKMKAELSGIKYSFVKVNKASTNLETKVVYSDFKY